MPDENEQITEETTQVTDEDKPTDETEAGEKPAEEKPEGETEEAGEGDPKEGEDDLPDWARTKLTKANTEAARYRTELREAEKKLENAKSLEEVDEIIAGLRTEREATERALLIENVALKHKLPDELAELLKGESREDLEAHAKVLQKFAPEADDDDEDIDLEGGLNPRSKDPEANLSPRELASRYGRGSKRRR